MSDSRVIALQSMVDEDPDDPFGRYALAMEYIKVEDDGLAADQFDEVIRRTPDYVPVYYQKARLLIKHEEPEAASGVIRLGIDAATAAGDTHAARELNELLETLS